MPRPCRAARLRPAAAALCALSALLAGCPDTARLELERRVSRLEAELADCRRLTVEQKTTIDELHHQLDVARAIDPDLLRRTYYPVRIEIDPLSGGQDWDGQPGDDGIVVYLRPLDGDGDAVKAAGEVRVQLFDLQNAPDAPTLIGEYYFGVDELRRHWYGKLLTYHYALRCPWRAGPPAHREITVRVTFVDYLLKRTMTAQRVCTVRLPP